MKTITREPALKRRPQKEGKETDSILVPHFHTQYTHAPRTGRGGRECGSGGERIQGAAGTARNVVFSRNINYSSREDEGDCKAKVSRLLLITVISEPVETSAYLFLVMAGCSREPSNVPQPFSRLEGVEI